MAKKKRTGRRREPLALVGIGCRFPGGANDAESFWALLRDGVDAITPVPETRWNAAAFYDPDPTIPGKMVSLAGGFIDNVDTFDAAFFGISPREAARMDPQQRMVLEVAWEALEDAGLAADRLAGSPTGVFVGYCLSDYGAVSAAYAEPDFHTGTGIAGSIVSNRISHRLDLRGPSISIDTACSSALVAVDRACRSVWEGECDLALAGGVNAILSPIVGNFFSAASMLSPDGRCKAFDARADGFVRGEGAGIVVLKPLRQAQEDGDRVYAVIRATAVNHDGSTSTITVPNGEAQEAMLREACARAGIKPEEVGYVEAHGTGTAVGDPIEARAIGRVFGAARQNGEPCLVGSVKTNIGHLESASGVAGLIKAVLCVHNKAIPPSLHFDQPNPEIPFDELRIKVPTDLTPWHNGSGPRIGAVNSFGFGGTNACAVIEEAPPPLPSATRPARRKNDAAPRLMPLSAASPEALKVSAGRMADWIASKKPVIEDLVGTAALRRAHLEHRLVLRAATARELGDRLRRFAEGEDEDAVIGSGTDAGAPAFLFTGQGAQWWGMGRKLFETDAVYREAVESCDALFRELSGWSLVAELGADEGASRLAETSVAQPAIFALQVGLAARWRAWGVEPSMVAGHSIGEIAAAHVAGALSLEDAVRVVYHRSRLQELARGQGRMAAVGLTPEQVRERLEKYDGRLEVAAINAPQLVTVSGDAESLEAFLADFDDDEDNANVYRQALNVDYAFHCWQMDPVEAELRKSLADIRSRRPRIPMLSTVTGAAVAKGELGAGYWWRNVRQPVQFQGAVEAMIDAGARSFLEIGPHAALTAPVAACLDHRRRPGRVFASLHRERDDNEMMADTLATLHVNGHDVDWDAIVGAYKFVSLPFYPWQRERHWVDTEESRAARFDIPSTPMLGLRLDTARPLWRSEIGTRFFPFLADHRIGGSIIFPAAAYIDMAFAAASEIFGETAWEFEDLTLRDALFLQPDRSVLLQTEFDPESGVISTFSREREGNASWVLRASTCMRACLSPPPDRSTADRENPADGFSPRQYYRRLDDQGYQYGPTFQGVEMIWGDEGMCSGWVRLAKEMEPGADRFRFHPTLLDSCFQISNWLLSEDERDTTLHIPVSAKRLRFFRPPGRHLFLYGKRVPSSEGLDFNGTVYNEDGEVVLVVEDLVFRVVHYGKEDASGGAEHYREVWVEPSASEPDAPGADGAESGTPGSWLIFTDRGGVGDAVADRLAAQGHACVRARLGTESGERSPGIWDLAPGDREGLDRLLASFGEAPLGGIVHLWSLDMAIGAEADGAALMEAQKLGSLAVLDLTHALIGSEAPAPRLWLATSGTWPVGDGEGVNDPAQAPLWGLARTLVGEHPELRATIVDLDPAGDSADSLVADLIADGPECEIAYRGEQRYVNRVERIMAQDIAPLTTGGMTDGRAHPYRLAMTAPGVLDNLYLREIAAPEPGPGEVVVRVRAVGLNFRDVMAATGLLPEEAEEGAAWQALGFECAGTIATVGEGVETFKVGDDVVALGRGCFASYAVLPAATVFAKPADLSFAEAATISVAFMTAWYALHTLGRLQKGERVLIHAATGGVGLAAVQVAQHLGAEIFATAGSPKKRAYLEELGVPHIMDSRTLDFADEIMAATDGAGVEVVLNSLPGAFMEKGISVLAPYGRFLEIGKRDIYENSKLGLYSLRENISFFIIDLARMGEQRPEILRQVMTDLSELMSEGSLSALPTEIFPASRAADAFRFMAQAKHIGKVVVDFDDPAVEVARSIDTDIAFAADRQYLVTGGLGGFGLEVAKWLVAHGARRLVLMSRSGDTGAEAEAGVAWLREAGAELVVAKGDVSRAEDVAAVMADIARSKVPLAGVFHAAAVLDDGFIAQLDHDRFSRVMAPKVHGAWNLHRATSDLKLDFFVLFSSISAQMGPPGQANYSAANLYLDALAQARRARGLAALSVNWGALAGTGILTRDENVAKYLKENGIQPLEIPEALEALGRLMRQDAGAVALARIDWRRLGKRSPAVAGSPRFAHLVAGAGEDGSHAGGGRIRGEVLAAPEEARRDLVSAYLRQQVARVLKTETAKIDPDRPLRDYGLDSLTAIELKNRIETDLGTTLSIAQFLERPHITGLADAFVLNLEAAEAQGAATDGGAEAASGEAPASSQQVAQWHIHRAAPENSAHQLCFAVAVRPGVDLRLLEEAFERTLTRHPDLLSRFPEADEAIRYVDARHPLGVVRHDASHLGKTDFQALLDASVHQPFDIAEGPLMRLHHYARPDDTSVLFLKVHHIIVDGWSVRTFLRDMLATYVTLQQGGEPEFPPAARYADYVRWQREMVEGPDGEAHLAYWRQQLAGPLPTLDLPTDRRRPASRRFAGGVHRFTVDEDITAGLQALRAGAGTTLYTVLLTGFKALLHRLTGQEDLVVGTRALGRTRPEFETMAGLLANPLAIRSRFDGARSFNAHLAEVDRTLNDALKHQDYPFALLVEKLGLAETPDRAPLFQVDFVMEHAATRHREGFANSLVNTAGQRYEFDGTVVETVGIARNRALYDLTFEVEEFDGLIYGIVDYDSALFEAATIERMADDFRTLLRAVVADPDRPIAELPLADAPAYATLQPSPGGWQSRQILS